MEKQKNLTANFKKIATNIESNRKNIENNNNIIENIAQHKSNFNEIQGLIKGQTGTIDSMKVFSKQSTTQAFKNIQTKRIFNSIFQRTKVQIKTYLQIVSQNFLVSYKQDNQPQNWQKVQKELQKSLNSLQQQSSNIQQMFESLQKLNAGKQNIIIQIMKLMIYQKNILWRDLYAPYDDYIHGQVKAIINQIKGNEQKLGYIPSKLKFQLPKFDTLKNQSSMLDLQKIHLKDFQQLVQGLKNYSKLSGQQQVIEDISKNQHVVKGLRERIQKLTINYDNLMEKYRNLQITKGKITQSQQKSLTQKIQQFQSIVFKLQQELLQSKQLNQKNQNTIQSLRDKNKQSQQQLSKFQKYQMPKIKQLQVNQKNILQEFIKVRRDLQTYSNIVNIQREQKLKIIDDLKDQKKRVNDLAYILGRERRKIKQLKEEINRKQQIIMELVDQKLQ